MFGEVKYASTVVNLTIIIAKRCVETIVTITKHVKILITGVVKKSIFSAGEKKSEITIVNVTTCTVNFR